MAAIAAALSTPANAQAVQRIAVGCGTSPVPKLCSVRAHWQHANRLRTALSLQRIPLHLERWHYASRRDRILTAYTQAHRRLLLQYLGITIVSLTPWTGGSWYQAAMCIHAGEGAWTSETGNGYHGGLQFSDSFQQTYGPEWVAEYGDAGHWPPVDQLHAAYRAWRIRGWAPWPNTAAACGLL
jgi:hypothetical protein